MGVIDLESEREEPSANQPLQVVDYKVSGKPLGENAAERETQASMYLAARWLEGSPVFRTPNEHTLTDSERGFSRWSVSF